MKKNYKAMRIYVCIFILSISLSGCAGKKAAEDEPVVVIEDYNKLTYEYFEAKRGDITPSMSFKISCELSEKVNYYPFKDGLEVESVNVSRGDTVSKGEVMVSFKSKELNEKLDEYNKRLEEDGLLLEHFNNLSVIEADVDYKPRLQEINQDIDVCQRYISELSATLECYSIKAKDNGVVTLVSELLNYGQVEADDNILSVTYGSGSYIAEVTAEDAEQIEIGEAVEAGYGSSYYEFVLTDKEMTEDDENVRLSFHLKGDETRLLEYDTLNVSIEKDTLTDVLYIPAASVFTVQGENYVYVVDDNGFRHGTKVKVLCEVDEYAVIAEGLNENDKVVIAK